MAPATTPRRRPDLLHIAGAGRLLRWRWGRLVFQLPLLLLALLMVFDGLTGPPLAAENIATVAAWVHYRGLVILALLLAGNLFCMACPFALLRTVGRNVTRRGRRWPRRLRNKWPAAALFFLFLWFYEAADLWASPLLTAGVVVAYFAVAFLLEAIFAESPFCKYLCPLGTFNFAASTISPLQIQARQPDVCRTCTGKECVNGSLFTSGCGTELFVPQIRSNMDCVFCLDCARACPYDNVALARRPALHELTSGAWPRRWDLGLLALLFAFAGLGNAFGMVPPVYALEAAVTEWLPFLNEEAILLLIFGVINLVLPVTLGLLATVIGRRVSGAPESLREHFIRFVPALMPLAFAIWLAHYSFHFAAGGLAIIPVLQNFLRSLGLPIQPNWMLGPLLPASWLMPLMVLALAAGLLASLYVAGERARSNARALRPRLGALPWAVLLVGMALAALLLFAQPMEMRGA